MALSKIKENLKGHLPVILVLCILGALYLFTAPLTVQSGDTGELVTNAFKLRVSHPPGYPLWTLLYHFPLKYLNQGNVFHTASLFTVAVALLSLGVLGFKFPKSWSLLAVIGTSTVIWKYSILPDVFALHMLFLSGVFVVSQRPDYLNKWWVVFLISLSVAHHHTILFAFPLFLYALWRSKFSVSKILICLVSGFFSLSLYLLLLTFYPNDFGSWGYIHSFKDVLDHFLRKEYGTFDLLAYSEGGLSWFSFFLDHFLTEMWGVLILIVVSIWNVRNDLKTKSSELLILFFSLILYFFAFQILAGDVPLNVEGEVVFERFLIQPLLLVGFLAIYLISLPDNTLQKFVLFLLLANGASNIYRNFPFLSLKQNTGIQDLIKNSVKDIPEGSVFYAEGDTFGFGLYYLQAVENYRPDLKLILPHWNTNWSKLKTRKLYPEVFAAEPSLSLVESVKLDTVPFYSNTVLNIQSTNIQVTYLGLVFHFSPGTSGELIYKCSDEYEWGTRPLIERFKRFDMGTYFDQAYGACHFLEGLDLVKWNRLEEARLSFQKSVALSPMNARFQERYCHVLSQLNHPDLSICNQRLEELLDKTHEQYYLNKYSL